MSHATPWILNLALPRLQPCTHCHHRDAARSVHIAFHEDFFHHIAFSGLLICSGFLNYRADRRGTPVQGHREYKNPPPQGSLLYPPSGQGVIFDPTELEGHLI